MLQSRELSVQPDRIGRRVGKRHSGRSGIDAERTDTRRPASADDQICLKKCATDVFPFVPVTAATNFGCAA